MTTLRATRKGKQQYTCKPALVSAPERDKRWNKLTILCDSQKHITYLDIHCNACLKHFNSSIDQNQRNERDEDLLFVCLPPLLSPSSPSSATRSQPWGYGHHPRGSRMQQRTRINVTRPLISTHISPSTPQRLRLSEFLEALLPME